MTFTKFLCNMALLGKLRKIALIVIITLSAFLCAFIGANVGHVTSVAADGEYTPSSMVGGTRFGYDRFSEYKGGDDLNRLRAMYEIMMEKHEQVNTSDIDYSVTNLTPFIITEGGAVSGDGAEYFSAGGVTLTDLFSPMELLSLVLSPDQRNHPIVQSIQLAVNTFSADNPQYVCFMNGFAVDFGNFAVVPLFPAEYRFASARREAYEKVEAKYAEYAALAGTVTGTVDKIRLVHDKMVTETDYSYMSDGEGGFVPNTAAVAHNIMGVMDTNSSGPVCESYAEANQYILTRLGIECWTVYGSTSTDPLDPGYHAWNIIKVDGDWYWHDVTWADMESTNPSSTYYDADNTKNILNYNYFLQGGNFPNHYPNSIDGVGSLSYGLPVPDMADVDIDITTETDYKWLTFFVDKHRTDYMVTFLTENQPIANSRHYDLGTASIDSDGILRPDVKLYEWEYDKDTLTINRCIAELVEGVDYEVVVEKPYKIGINRVYIYGKGDYRGVGLGVVSLNSLIPLPPVILVSAYYGQTLSQIELPAGWIWDNSTDYVGNTGEQLHFATFAGDEQYMAWSGEIVVTVNKTTPIYGIPADLTAIYGETLAEIALPDGWAWKTFTDFVGEVGVNSHAAIFTPTDTDNYLTVTRILTVTVAAPNTDGLDDGPTYDPIIVVIFIGVCVGVVAVGVFLIRWSVKKR